MISTVLEQSLIFGILALGAYISYKILDFPDLTVQGTFPLGAAVSCVLIIKGVNPFVACIASFFAGAFGGMITGLIHVKLKITDLLSGIIVMTALYSINLNIAGKSNLPIFNKMTIFGSVEHGFTNKLLISFIMFIIAKILLDIYLKTKSGYLLRASGDNQQFVISLGKDVGTMRILGLSIANGLAALSGSIWCQYQRMFTVDMGTNMIVIGLASVIIGINILQKISFINKTTMVLFGCFIYEGCFNIAINLGVPSSFLNLIISILFLLALLLNKTGGSFSKLTSLFLKKEV